MINFNGADWAQLEVHLDNKIDEDIDALKNPKLDQNETQYYRGRISAMEDLIDLHNRPEELKGI